MRPDQVMRVREGEPQKRKKWKSPNQGPQEAGKGRRFHPGPASRAGAESMVISAPPEGWGLTHSRCSINTHRANE